MQDKIFNTSNTLGIDSVKPYIHTLLIKPSHLLQTAELTWLSATGYIGLN